jgi:hypothetical protein
MKHLLVTFKVEHEFALRLGFSLAPMKKPGTRAGLQ